MEWKNKSVIFTEAGVRTLMNLGYCDEGITTFRLSKDVGLTYSHMYKKIVIEMEILGIIERKKEGRNNKIKLTKKGREIFKHLEIIGELIES